ncbi:Transcriptional regulator, LysR family [Candidatus Propionivibrio aalborgensis]|uniref:Transcriptional regulator, LysR family n=1 Tax=Candidatus Propionivibrio aalborgensis TaxID=1860101 RepID=A0A1A8XRM3_9RHOO|nr:LysR family transcriptional regulator [Candidatus Propionivibrio aalborgensis]SBT06613.1 Transcriptional regulator, LysR family [Candidatus Propionivibrio aalborgensis]
MDTESVRLFVLAAEKLNISAAGRALDMAPAVASARLAKLETLLGADLLHRSTRKVALSLEGAEFLPYAREILAQENSARAALGLGRPTVTGTLRFATSSTFAQLHIAPLVPEFLTRNPGIKLDLRLSDTPFDLIEGSFDLALRSAALADSSLKCRKLADDRRILCASPGYLHQRGIPRHPDDLAGHQLIGFRNASPKELIGRDGQTGLFYPGQAGGRLVLDDGLSQKIVTLAGAGISMNSLWNVYSELADGTLIRILPEYEINDQSSLWLVYPKSNVLTAKVRIFIDFLLEKIAASPVWA